MNGAKKYWLETYGCQMNFAESNAIESSLLKAGLEKAESPDKADFAILNTCSVRKTAENRIWGRIGYFQHLKESKPMKLIIAGCMAERLGDEFIKEAPAVDHVVGTNDKLRIAALLSGASDEQDAIYSFTTSYHKQGDVKSFVPIMNGCNNFCTYCIVPYVRGREISRSPQSIYDEIASLEERGVKEITLLGQNVNSYYFKESGKTLHFYDLISEIASRLKTVRWIRFESPHPKDFSDHLIEVIATEKRVAKHLHIPLQSGSSRILELMNRKYSREDYLRLINKIKSSHNEITLTTDVMVGFPSETEEEFLQTLSLMEEVQFLEAFMYYFNPREGTKAVTMDKQVPSELRMERLQRLIDFQRGMTTKIKSSRVGRVTEILVEGISKKDDKMLLGRTQSDEMVVFNPISEIKVGDFVKVELAHLAGNTYLANQLR